MIKAIIFDFGSVCFKIDWETINAKMMEKFGISTLIRSNYGEEINELYDKAIRGEISLKNVFEEIMGNRKLNVDDAINYYKELYKKYKTMNEQVMVLIKQLRKKLKIVGLTDTNDIHFQAYEEQGQLKNFDFVFASFRIGKMKKDKGVFGDVLDKLKLRPEEIIFIDDSDKNLENAKSYGIKTIKYENYKKLIEGLKNLGVSIWNLTGKD